jgi:hypothetical protein
VKKQRLPGIRFEPQAPLLDDGLPRMDIAIFAGFAARGDFHRPVAVESAAEFSAIFGDDLDLAWDNSKGVTLRAYLAPTVRAFFRNGGRRCWIIRLPHPQPGPFHTTDFFDAGLVDSTSARLIADANHIRFETERELSGIHAALTIEEASIIAVPDAVHLGWRSARLPDTPTLHLPDTPPPADWWPHPHCAAERTTGISEPQTGAFLNWDVRILPMPTLRLEDHQPVGESANFYMPPQPVFTLMWDAQGESGTRFTLQEATRPNFSDAAMIYSGDQTTFTVWGRKIGDFFYRVRTEVGGQTGEWSTVVTVRLAVAGAALVNLPDLYDDAPLLDVQRALLHICAARGDLFAVLSLPEHYQTQAAIAHVEKLMKGLDSHLRPSPLLYLSDTARSYGALFHPWLVGREENHPEELRFTPPDGAISGIMAKRARERGAWISPANEVLHGVVALTPAIPPQQWLALDLAQVNLIRQEPRGFLTLSADTLSGTLATPSNDTVTEHELALISVRRLLSLLQRLALREGTLYVFEPNDESFRRMVKRNFERFLEQLYGRGAFAGRSSTSAYQVVTDSTINTATLHDQGRFLVELRVAPSQPLKFLTVRLLHSGDRLLVSESTT